MVLLLLIHFLFLPPLFCGGFVFGPYFVVQYFVFFLSFAIILMGKRELNLLYNHATTMQLAKA